MESEIIQVTLLSLQVSLTALLPFRHDGYSYRRSPGLEKIPGKRIWLNTIYTLMGLPPVLSGLWCICFYPRGPLRSSSCCFLPVCHVFAQVLPAAPIVRVNRTRASWLLPTGLYDTLLRWSVPGVSVSDDMREQTRHLWRHSLLLLAGDCEVGAVIAGGLQRIRWSTGCGQPHRAGDPDGQFHLPRLHCLIS
jgi:tungstate transport system permease protein